MQRTDPSPIADKELDGILIRIKQAYTEAYGDCFDNPSVKAVSKREAEILRECEVALLQWKQRAVREARIAEINLLMEYSFVRDYRPIFRARLERLQEKGKDRDE